MARRHPGWIPQQHGAWAMLVVPFVAGVLHRVQVAQPLPAHLVPLFAFWFVGYFAFNALSTWLKAAPARRPPLLHPLVTYAAAAAVLGLVTLALAGPAILGWVPVYAVLLIPAIVLAAQRHERATLGGGLTTAAASVMALVVTQPDPTALLRATNDDRAALALAGLVFAYFFGTVLYVKTNIRARGSQAFYAASVAWHALATAIAAALAAGGAASWLWTPLFAVATLRAILVPRLHPPVTPLRIGLLEIALSAAILLIAAFA